MELRINFEGVQTCISSMETAITDLQTAAGKIDSTVESELGTYWEGNSYNKCISVYESDYKNMLTQQVPDLVAQLKDFMQTCRNCLEEADHELAGG